MKRIAREELRKMMDAGAKFVLIDAREHDAYDKGHLPGAVSIPSDHLGKHTLSNYPKDALLVTYCSGWDCEASTIAAEKLETYGYSRVLEFKGGLEDWKAAKYALETA